MSMDDMLGPRPVFTWPDWYTPNRRGAKGHDHHVANGRHPFGAPLAHNGETCGTCGHRRSNSWGRKTYYKCGLRKATAGPGTDLRLKWAACRLWMEGACSPST